jgi:hypothetical protein
MSWVSTPFGSTGSPERLPFLQRLDGLIRKVEGYQEELVRGSGKEEVWLSWDPPRSGFDGLKDVARYLLAERVPGDSEARKALQKIGALRFETTFVSGSPAVVPGSSSTIVEPGLQASRRMENRSVRKCLGGLRKLLKIMESYRAWLETGKRDIKKPKPLKYSAADEKLFKLIGRQDLLLSNRRLWMKHRRKWTESKRTYGAFRSSLHRVRTRHKTPSPTSRLQRKPKIKLRTKSSPATRRG